MFTFLELIAEAIFIVTLVTLVVGCGVEIWVSRGAK